MAALRRDFDARPAMVVAAIVGGVGALAFAIGVVVDTRRALAAYLAAWTYAATLVVGGLFVLLIGYAANARWPAAVRRLTEMVAVGVVPIAILFIPLALGAREIWPWAGGPSPTGYLTLSGLVIRAAIYFGIWIAVAELLVAWSRRRDRNPMPQVGHGIDALDRERGLACAAIPIGGLALTFASFDWLMSLDPEWWSSAFGLYVLTSALLAGMAMTIFLAWRGVANGAMPVPPGVFHAMGRLLHAFVILWTYIAYFQAMLIQIANKPNEVRFYVDRVGDGWRFVTALLVILKFALPFPLLLSRRLKRRAAYVGAIAVIILVGQYVDMWWLVIPRLESSPIPSWTDLAALCAIGGLVTCCCAWRMRGSPLLPIGDPYLADGLAYETSI